MSVYEVLINGEKVNVMLTTNKDLADIDIKNLLKNIEVVNTYKHYKDDNLNDYYELDGGDIVTFNRVAYSENMVIE
jgi:hypothetical protein